MLTLVYFRTFIHIIHTTLMNKNIIFSFLLCCTSLTVFSKRQNINNDWGFQRLTEVQETSPIKNQGSDWESQYSVEHVSLTANELHIPENILRDEFSRLSAGVWETVRLPHTPFIENLIVVHQWQGICYYKKQLSITAQEAKNQLWIEFEGAMQLADVWINGSHIMQNAGGYNTFVVNVTGLLQSDKPNEILVRLDNKDNGLIPPGKPLNTLDFCYYGGIYRDVNLIVKPSVHITHPILANRTAGGGIFVTYPKVSEQEAELRLQTEVTNTLTISEDVIVKHTLFAWNKESGKGNIVKDMSQKITLSANDTVSIVQTMTIENPYLWSPDMPNLYVLTAEIFDTNSTLLDQEETRIGIRRYEITREKGFVLNGKPLRLVGSNRHMEYPYVGNAISDNAQYRDIYQIKNNGFNLVRLGHYPQDISVLNACDELGLLVINPIPGWQFYNDNDVFKQLTYRDIRDLIRRDRNHPSVILWETTLNEAWPPTSWKDKAVQIAHEEYPTDQCFTAGDAYGYEGFDISYNDWEEGFNRPNNTKNPSFIREYYDYEFGGHYSSTRVTRGDGENALIQNAWNAQWSHNRYRAYYPWTIGDAIWSMYDYNRGCCDKICYSGVADIFRIPKFSLSFFRTQVPAETPLPKGKMPYEVFIAAQQMPSQSNTVLVYGNVDEVALLLNNKEIKRQTPDRGSNTQYVTLPDGGNCQSLTYSPFTFTDIPRKQGKWQAVGYLKGEKVAEYTLHTPQKPAKIDISYFEEGCPASKYDLLIVYVSIKDMAGTLCPINGRTVTLAVEGGEIVGPNTYKTEAGIASFLVKTANSDDVSIYATAGKLKSSKVLNLVF